ncbi:hypothetical protein GBAR_LOCUS30036, partial [Geodia barretti]
MIDEVDSMSWAQKPNYQSTFYRRNSQDSFRIRTSLSQISSLCQLHATGLHHSLIFFVRRDGHLTPPVVSSFSVRSSAPVAQTRPGQAFPTQQALL